MIRTLDDAWKWYKAVDRLARHMRRMAANYWDRDELSNLLARDSIFRNRTAAEIRDDANLILDELEDLAVLILFTVFEAEVRDVAQLDAERLLRETSHPAMLSAAKDLEDAIKRGSFSQITAAYQPMDVDMTAQIDQIRAFRNWVAHGRRGLADNLTNPGTAVERMRRYVEKIGSLVTAPEGNADGCDRGRLRR
jgi:hypothetical protein